jgi:hypothetical protein
VADYFFHICDGERVYADEDGMRLSNASAALREARTAAWALMCDLSRAVQGRAAWWVKASDEIGRVPAITPFNHVLGREPARRQMQAGEGGERWD